MIISSLGVHHVRRWGAGLGLVGAVAVSVTVLGMAAAHADEGADQINGWTVSPTGETSSWLSPAALLDPSDSLGLGTAPIAGDWGNADTLVSSVGTDDVFLTPDKFGSTSYLQIDSSWLFDVDGASVNTGLHNSVDAWLVSVDGGRQQVDLFNISHGDAPPLFNPEATGPIQIGGVELDDPHGGALLNDLFDAAFKGDTADWTNSAVLFDDLLGIDPSGGSDAVDASSMLPGV